MELYQFPWEDLASQGLPLPKELPLVDQMAYMGLRHIYWALNAGRINLATAHYEKAQLRHEYESTKAKMKYESDLCTWHTDLRKEIEGAQCRYRKERTLEAADKLSAVLDGRLNHGK